VFKEINLLFSVTGNVEVPKLIEAVARGGLATQTATGVNTRWIAGYAPSVKLLLSIAAALLIGIAIGFGLGGRQDSRTQALERVETASDPVKVPNEPSKKMPSNPALPAPRLTERDVAKPSGAPRPDEPLPGALPVPPPPGYAGDSVFTQGVKSHRPPPPAWLPAEKKVSRLSSEREIEDFNRSVRASNIASYVVNALPFVPHEPASQGGPARPSGTEPMAKPPSFDKILGNYEGEIRFDDGKKIWQMTLELSGKVDGQKLKGKSLVELSEAGTVISTMTQTGELSLLKKLADESVGILLVPADGQYFQLYHVKDRDLLTGNYYVKEGPTEYVPKGTVRLSRKAAPRG